MSLAHTDADLDRTIDRGGRTRRASRRVTRAATRSFFVGHAALAHVVHEEQAPGDDEHHHREEHEREPTAGAFLATVDELLRARGRREHAERGEGGDAQGRTGDGEHAA